MSSQYPVDIQHYPVISSQYPTNSYQVWIYPLPMIWITLYAYNIYPLYDIDTINNTWLSYLYSLNQLGPSTITISINSNSNNINIKYNNNQQLDPINDQSNERTDQSNQQSNEQWNEMISPMSDPIISPISSISSISILNLNPTINPLLYQSHLNLIINTIIISISIPSYRWIIWSNSWIIINT